MTAVIVEFPAREKSAERPAKDPSHLGQVIIFTGVRHERLDEVTPATPTETDTPRTPRRNKTS